MTLADTLIWFTAGLVASPLAYLALRWTVRKMHASNDRARERTREKWAGGMTGTDQEPPETNSGDQGGLPMPSEPGDEFYAKRKVPETGSGRPVQRE